VQNPLGGNPDHRDYKNYTIVKTAFDQLNYGNQATNPLANQHYVFNPWVVLIHGNPKKPGIPAYALNMPCSYAYSVDDAQGNVQAEATGFVLDISSTVNLKNMNPCSPPININLGYDPNVTPRFYKYAVCKNTSDRVKPVIPGFASFIISAQNPAGCPIYLWDNVINKGQPTQKEDTNPAGPPLGQMYTFLINGDVSLFPSFTPPFTSTAPPQPPPYNNPPPNWSNANHAIIGCKGDVPPPGPNPNPPYSSQVWCCNSAASSGVFTFSEPVIAANKSVSYNATTIPAMKCTDATSCQRAIGNSTPCNTNF
jgi:hypothetical protein